MELGNKILQLRKKANFSQEEIHINKNNSLKSAIVNRENHDNDLKVNSINQVSKIKKNTRIKKKRKSFTRTISRKIKSNKTNNFQMGT